MPVPLKLGQKVIARISDGGRRSKEVKAVIARESNGNGHSIARCDNDWRVLDKPMLMGLHRDTLHPVDDPPKKPIPNAPEVQAAAIELVPLMGYKAARKVRVEIPANGVEVTR